MTRILAICIVALAGCGSAPPAVQTQSYEVRLLGAHAGQLSALLMDVKDVSVTLDGKALEVKPGQRNIDLARENQAWLLGSFRAPEGTSTIHVAIQLDDFGGYESAGDAGFVDGRYARVELDAPRAWLAGHGSATVELDASRSLVGVSDGVRRMVPQVRVLY